MLDRGRNPSLLPPILVAPPSESPDPALSLPSCPRAPGALATRQPYNRRRVLTRLEGTDVLSAVIFQLPALLRADCEYIFARVALSSGH
jgi:hypothetical protein